MAMSNSSISIEILKVVAWPATALIVIFLFRRLIDAALVKGGAFTFRLKDVAEFSIQPTHGIRPPADTTVVGDSGLVQDVATIPAASALPHDYYFLKHTSFLRGEKQAEFRKRTGVSSDHYDIRVVVGSYYKEALQRIDHVVYVLHDSYSEPVRFRRRQEDRFLLKELAYGEFVILAKIFMKDRVEPVILQRYITLWESGPRIPRRRTVLLDSGA